MKSKKRLAAAILNTAPSKIRFADGALEDIRKAITRSDIRGLIAVHKIWEDGTNQHSRGRARERSAQKRKGRRVGRGSAKGPKYSSLGRKRQWILRIRAQREFLKQLRESQLLSMTNYHQLYAKSKGGYFRNIRHIKLYLTEHNLVQPRGGEKK